MKLDLTVHTIQNHECISTNTVIKPLKASRVLKSVSVALRLPNGRGRSKRYLKEVQVELCSSQKKRKKSVTRGQTKGNTDSICPVAGWSRSEALG